MKTQPTKFCVDCKHCTIVPATTGGKEPSYQCHGVISEIHGHPLNLPCKEARTYYCKADFWVAKEQK